jgi:hypothetical protein
MSRIIRPVPGECADRQTILELKMKYGGTEEPVNTSEEIRSVGDDGGSVATITRRKFKRGKMNIQPFIDEHEMIQSYLQREWFAPSQFTKAQADEFDSLYDELREVNGELWKLTDQGHILLEASRHGKDNAYDQRAAEVMYSTILQNDKRAEIVGKINMLFSINVVEKIFP